jgi:KAP family P-loop domain/TIR domain
MSRTKCAEAVADGCRPDQTRAMTEAPSFQPPGRRASYVFLSYAHEDADIAVRLIEELTKAGISVRSARDVGRGESIQEQLRAFQEGATAVVVLWTEASVSSEAVLREAMSATTDGTYTPAVIGGFDVLPSAFRRYHTIDLTGWVSGDDPNGVGKLIEALHSRLAQPTIMSREATSEAAPQEAPTSTVGPSDSRLPAIRPAARELLDMAAGMADAAGSPATEPVHLLLAALVRPLATRLDRGHLRQGITHALFDAVDEPRETRAEDALRLFGVTLDDLRRGRVDPLDPQVEGLVRSGVRLMEAVGATELWSHHLAGLAVRDAVLPLEVREALGISEDELREALRTAVERGAPEERAAVWDEILGIGFQAEPKVARDYWTVEDRLGSRAYAEAISSFVVHRDTKPPLTIGVKAPWGAGKTSLMRMVQAELDPPENPSDSRWTFLPIRMTTDGLKRLYPDNPTETRASRPQERLSVRRGLRLLHKSPPEPPDLASVKAATVDPTLASDAAVKKNAVDADRWRSTVWFNPWMYQRGEEVWAGFANEIVHQIESRLPIGQRERFWFELNIRRLDRNAVRRRLYAALLERFGPWLLGLVAAAVVVAITVAAVTDANPLAWASFPLAALLGVPLVGASVVKVGDLVRSLVRPPAVSGLAKHATELLKGATNEFFPDPAYESRTGFLAFVHNDMRLVLDLVATPERPLVIFVDDLDRCSPGVVAQTIEAINLFLAGEFPNVVFVLAIEPSVVAAHVEVAHKDLVERLRNDRLNDNWSTLGWRFLEKIVQLPLTLPRPSKLQATEYLDSLFGRLDTAGSEPGDPSERIGLEQGVARRAEALANSIGPSTLEQLPDRLAQAEADLGPVDPRVAAWARERAVADVFPRYFRDDDPLVQAVVSREARQLGGQNPREVKRLLNLFRFYSLVASRQRALGNASTESVQIMLEKVARLAVLAIRWPYLLNVVARPSLSQPTEPSERSRILLEDLEEAAAKDDDAWENALVKAGLADRVAGELRSEPWAAELRTFCSDRRRIGEFARSFV